MTNLPEDVVNTTMLDIIIPVLNEEMILAEQARYYRALATFGRLIFVDGGSDDQTAQIASRYGEVVQSPRGRARQKNQGALAGSGEYLLFLNVDSFVDFQALKTLKKSLEANCCGGGCFTMAINDEKRIFRIYERIVNWRAKVFKVIDGDLGIFVQRSLFEQVGRYDKLPIMEDLLFSRKLRRVTNVVKLPEKITVSSRKWHEIGFLKTFGLYTLAYVQLWTFIPFFKDQYHYGKKSERPDRLRAGTERREGQNKASDTPVAAKGYQPL